MREVVMNKYIIKQPSTWLSLVFFILAIMHGSLVDNTDSYLIILSLLSLFNLLVGCYSAIHEQLKDIQKGISNE